MQSVFNDETAATILFETGYQKPLSKLTMEDKEEVTQVISAYHTLIKVKAEIDQFVLGLQCLKIYDYIVKYPEMMMPLFVHHGKKLTAGTP